MFEMVECLNISTGQADEEEKSGQWLGATVVTSPSTTNENDGKVLVGTPTLSVSNRTATSFDDGKARGKD